MIDYKITKWIEEVRRECGLPSVFAPDHALEGCQVPTEIDMTIPGAAKLVLKNEYRGEANE